MEAPGIALHDRHAKRSHRRLICIALAVIIVIAAVVIPVGVVFSQRHRSHGLPSTVLVPLYSYPANDAWDPLYRAVASRPDLNFTVVVNPSSGPGDSSTPGSDYVPAIQKLNSFQNVQTVGYVHTSLATRDIDDVLNDVTTYAGWSGTTNLSMHGIFFDEFPVDYTEATEQYTVKIDEAVKTANGIQEPRLVIHNPGAIPDDRLVLNTTDETIIFEGTYEHFEEQLTTLSDMPLDRSRYGILVHSVPSSTNEAKLVNHISQSAQSLFVSDKSQNYYETWGGDWTGFVKSVKG